jgi:hypothetical protein
MSQEDIPLGEKAFSLFVEFPILTKSLVISLYMGLLSFVDVTFPVYVR